MHTGKTLAKEERGSNPIADRLGLPTEEAMQAKLDECLAGTSGKSAVAFAIYAGWLEGVIDIARNRALSIKEEVPQ